MGEPQPLSVSEAETIARAAGLCVRFQHDRTGTAILSPVRFAVYRASSNVLDDSAMVLGDLRCDRGAAWLAAASFVLKVGNEIPRPPDAAPALRTTFPAGRAVAAYVDDPDGHRVVLADRGSGVPVTILVGTTAAEVGEAGDALRRLALRFPEEERDGDLAAELDRILQGAGATVTFDAERDNTHPCFSCGVEREPGSAHHLVPLFFPRREGKPRVVSRPFCGPCVDAGKPRTVVEHDVDARTIRRIAADAKTLLDENDRLRDRLRERDEQVVSTARALPPPLSPIDLVARDPHAPRRWRQIIPNRSAGAGRKNGAPLFGVYFPGTDLCVTDMGGRGTGEPRGVEWIDGVTVTAPAGEVDANPRAHVRGLWRMNGVPGGKYLVLRRDGSVFEHPCFVLGARDPVAPEALRAYAEAAEEIGFDAQYVTDVHKLAGEFAAYRNAHGCGDPTAPPHRKDDAAIVALMEKGKSA